MKGTCVRSHAHDRSNTSVLMQLPKPRLKTCHHTLFVLLPFVTYLVTAENHGTVTAGDLVNENK